MNAKIFYATAGMGQKVQAQALVASDGFSARYDLDRIRGVFSRPEHSSPVKAIAAAFWYSMRLRAALPPRGCCTR
jgi:hypothetical protein